MKHRLYKRDFIENKIGYTSDGWLTNGHWGVKIQHPNELVCQDIGEMDSYDKVEFEHQIPFPGERAANIDILTMEIEIDDRRVARRVVKYTRNTKPPVYLSKRYLKFLLGEVPEKMKIYQGSNPYSPVFFNKFTCVMPLQYEKKS